MSIKGPFPYSDAAAQLYLGENVSLGQATPEAFPIYQTSSYTFPDLKSSLEARKEKGFVYGRTNHPNYVSLSELITHMEKSEDAWVVSSGMFSIFVSILTCVKGGEHVVCNKNLYGETHDILKKLLPEYGIEATFADFTDPAAIRAAVRPNTKLFYCEVIANPMTALADIGMVADLAHAAGCKLLVDNTFSSPYVIRPLEHGADIVINSLTKYINGHFDMIGGAIASTREFIDVVKYRSKIFGGCLAPFACWLALRGARTFDLRLERQNRNAVALARALEENPMVERVFHPSLDSHPQAELARKMFRPDACGAMLSFNLNDDIDRTDRFLGKLKMVGHASTLGGFRTTVAHPASASHKELNPEEKATMFIHQGTIRVSVGMEPIDDIVRDFSDAIEASK